MSNRLFAFLGSLKLTVVFLALAMVLVFLGTMAQVEQGLYVVQKTYFQSFFVTWAVPGLGWKLPVFPGGYLIGVVLTVNLVVAPLLHFERSWKKYSLLLVHAGMIVLLAGMLATDLSQSESHLRLAEGETRNYSESDRLNELVLIGQGQEGRETVVAIPESQLKPGASFRLESLPFAITVESVHPRADVLMQPPATNARPVATQGLGRDLYLSEGKAAASPSERSQTSVILRFDDLKGGASLGTWLASVQIMPQQPVTAGGQTFRLGMRPTRYYKPFSLHLVKFIHERYAGSDVPRAFASIVRLQSQATGEDREVKISMNNPLRYGGETFYQSGYDENNPGVTILQVVRNPVWLTPYLSSALITLGLSLHFLLSWVEAARKRRTS